LEGSGGANCWEAVLGVLPVAVVQPQRHQAGWLAAGPEQYADALTELHGIAAALVLSESAIEKHVSSIFAKLALAPEPTQDRRVTAVLTFLRDSPAQLH
jgi:hypothetical protein